MSEISDKNYKWIYTYDYAPDSVWEPWRTTTGEPKWIADEVSAVCERIKRDLAGRVVGELSTFLLLADSHYTYNGTWDDTISAMRRLVSELDISGVIHLGDLTDGLLPLVKTQTIEEKCLMDLQSLDLPVMIVPGNHDYNYFRRNPEIRYPDMPQFYVDMPGSGTVDSAGIRLIFIDSFDPKEAVRYGFTEYCIHWLDATLNMMPEGYSAIIFSHLPPLVRLQAWTKDIRNRGLLIDVLNNYSDRIMAYINGHNHCDLLYNDLYNGQFPVVSINCAKCEYFTEHKPEDAVVPERRLGDRTQESFDIMQIDAANRIIYFTRFGAGIDRIIRDHRAEYVGSN